MTTEVNFKELPGIAATPELASGNPVNLPHLVQGMDSVRGRLFMGHDSAIREVALEPNVIVSLTGDDRTVQLPVATLNQVHGIKFLGMADEQQVVINANGTNAFAVTDDEGNYETQCLWDLPVRNSVAWFIAVEHPSDNTKLLWEHR